MVLDVHRTSLEVAQPLRKVGREEPFDEVLGDKIDVRREDKFVLEDALVDLEWVVGEEGREASEELEQENAERPPVGGGSVTCGRDLVAEQRVSAVDPSVALLLLGRRAHDLRRKVFGRSAEGVGAIRDVLGEAKVGDLEVALVKRKEIRFRLR